MLFHKFPEESIQAKIIVPMVPSIILPQANISSLDPICLSDGASGNCPLRAPKKRRGTLNCPEVRFEEARFRRRPVALLFPRTPFLDSFRVADDRCSINSTSAWWLLVCGPGKQQQIPIRIFDDETLGAPRLLFQCLLKGNSSGLKFKKQ